VEGYERLLAECGLSKKKVGRLLYIVGSIRHHLPESTYDFVGSGAHNID
jgi:hypothetical protein